MRSVFQAAMHSIEQVNPKTIYDHIFIFCRPLSRDCTEFESIYKKLNNQELDSLCNPPQ